MSKILFDVDRHSGVIEHIGKNDKGNIVIQRTQNTNAILDANRQEMNGNVSTGWKGDMHKVASIPLIIIDQWREELKAKGASNSDPLHKDNRAYFIAKINSSEWSKLRTKQGRV